MTTITNHVQAMLGPAGEMNAIPGEAGVDYPVYNSGGITPSRSS